MWVATSIAITLLCAVSLAHAGHRLGWVKIPDASRRIGCIDGLRGYLAIGVFMYHCIIWLYVLEGHEWGPPPGNAYANLGQATVALFFMITSILFYPKILRRLSDSEWLAHFISRIFRLTPLLWAVTAAVACIVIVQNGFRFVGRADLQVLFVLEWLSFYALPNLFGHVHTDRIIAGVTWSLVFEWGFYIFLPAFSYFVAFARDRVRPLVMLLVGFFCFEWFIYRHYVGPRYYILFVVGLLVAETVRTPKIALLLRSPWAAVIGLAALLAEFLLCSTAYGPVAPVLLGIFLAPVAAGNSYFKIFSLTGSIVLGEISYGIYLLHGIVLYVALNVSLYPPGLYLMPLLAPIVVIAAILGHRFVETPGIELGRRLAHRLQLSRPPAPWLRPSPALVPNSPPAIAKTLT